MCWFVISIGRHGPPCDRSEYKHEVVSVPDLVAEMHAFRGLTRFGLETTAKSPTVREVRMVLDRCIAMARFVEQ